MDMSADGDAVNAARSVNGALLKILLMGRRTFTLNRQGIRILAFFADLLARLILMRIDRLHLLKIAVKYNARLKT